MKNFSPAAQEVKIIAKLDNLTPRERQELKKTLNCKQLEYQILIKRYWYEGQK